MSGGEFLGSIQTLLRLRCSMAMASGPLVKDGDFTSIRAVRERERVVFKTQR